MISDSVSPVTEEASVGALPTGIFDLDEKKNAGRCSVACMNFVANGVISGLCGAGYFIASALRPDDLARDGVRTLVCTALSYGLNLIVGAGIGHVQGRRHYEEIKSDIAESYRRQWANVADLPVAMTTLEKMKRKTAMAQCTVAMVTTLCFFLHQNGTDILPHRRNAPDSTRPAQMIPKAKGTTFGAVYTWE